MTTPTVSKSELLALVADLPDEMDIEELIYRLYLRERMAIAEQEIAGGETLSDEEVRARMQSWRA